MDLGDVRITKDSVFIDGQKLPGVIEKEGVTVYPGGAATINKMTVTFLVGKVDMEDPSG